MVNAIIFDFDGVVLESLNVKTNAFKKLYEPYGSDISKRVVEHHLENGGVSRFDKIKIYHNNFLGEDIDEKKIQKIAQKFSEMVVNEIMKVPFVDGAKQFIEDNYKRYLMFISSATPMNELNFICKQRKIAKYFQGIFGSPDSKSKHISSIITNYSLNNREIVFIGDSSSDLDAANTHNLTFIARLSGVSNNLVNEKYTLSDLNKLGRIISIINNYAPRHVLK
tara:strand:+ start:38 stop:706 length:669 start_codon:yes stop_codon:yes gene_type:complete